MSFYHICHLELHFFIIHAALDHTPCQCTATIISTGVLAILLAVCVVVFTTLVIVVIIREKRRSKSDVYYDTVNIGHHSKPSTAIETELNVAYGPIAKPT